MRAFAIATTVVSLVLFGCATTGTTSKDAEAHIRAEAPRFMEAFNRADWDAVSRFFADDAVALAPNSEIARGPAAIRQTFSAFQSMKPRLSFSSDRIVQSCDMAYEYGTYQMQMSSSAGAAMNDRGKYVTVWRKMPGGEWKIVATSSTTSLPAPGM